MPEEKKIAQKIKDIAILIGFIITLASIAISWSNGRTQRALLEDQVKRNTEILTAYDLKVISYRLDEIDESLGKIDTKISDVIKLLIE